MRGVSLLIRLAQHDLEERRSDLGCISRAQTETESAIGALDQSVTSEMSIAMVDSTAVTAFGAWARQSARGRTALENRSRELHQSAVAARENLRETAAQVRRLEIALETDREKARRLSVRRADAKADERELVRYTGVTSH
jgi:hypothetical protein